MAFMEKLRILIDVDSKNATTGIAGFKKSVAEADGFTGKLRAGVGSLGATFGSFIRSPAGAAVAVGAAGAAMYKAVDAASDLALEVGRLSDATGLSAEAASRWIEVGKDMGIGGDQIASMISKLTASLGKTPEKFEALGVSVKYASDGTVDMQATLLGAIDVLNKTADPTKRAALAQQLFGKSWKEAAELIGAGAAKVKEKLDDVSGAKLIDQKEIEQARKFRDTMDALADVGENLAVTVGQVLIPVLNAVVPVLTDLAELTGDVSSAVKWLADDFVALGEKLSPGDFELNIAALQLFKEKLEQADTATVELGDASKEAHIELLKLEEGERLAADEASRLAAAVERADAALSALEDEISDDKAVADLEIGMRNLADTIGDMGILEATSALAGMKLELIDTLEGLEGISKGAIVQIVGEYNGTNLDEIIQKVMWLQANANFNTGHQVIGGSGGLTPNKPVKKVPGKARGGSASGLTLVGEEGPELVNLPGGSFVHTAGQTRGMLGGGGSTNVTVNVNVGPGADPVSVGRATADALAAYYRNGGSRP